jgi:hypothetical protein
VEGQLIAQMMQTFIHDGCMAALSEPRETNNVKKAIRPT